MLIVNRTMRYKGMITNTQIETLPIISKNDLEIHEQGEIGVVTKEYACYGEIYGTEEDDAEVKGILPMPFPTYQISVALLIS
jgi:hypothetical protein